MASRNISIATTNKALSSKGGLVYFDSLVNQMGFEEGLREILPKEGRDQIMKFKSLLYGMICGLDSLNDISFLRKDKLFSELTNGACADSTLGDFLRAFSDEQVELLNEFLSDMAFKLSRVLFPDDDFIIYSSDSFPNEQTGKKIEGVGWNHKRQWCLDTLGLYDHHGFHYAMDVRPGGTYSSKGHSFHLARILKKTDQRLSRYFHGDSAFSNREHYNVCIEGDCRFVMCLSKRSWGPLLHKEDLTWEKTSLEFFDSQECEVAQCSYKVKDLSKGREELRVVFIRAPKQEKQLDFLDGNYHYYAFVTDLVEGESLPVMQKREYIGPRGAQREELVDYEMVPATMENVISFYRSRSNTENFIREEKNGIDLKHYPCSKLRANKVFGLVGALSYNLMRFSSFGLSKRGCYSKKIRLFLVESTLPSSEACEAIDG